MPVFSTNKTVPLAKDLASSSTFTQAIGISTARTDLDTILTAIDAAISLSNSSWSTAVSNEATIRANADSNLQNQITNEVTNRTNAVSAEATTRANADTAEATTRANANTALQTEVDGERSPLRLTSTGLNTQVAIASAAQTRTDATGNSSALGVPNGSLISDFLGCSIDFAAGTITYTGSYQAAGSFSRISFSGNAGKYAKYAVVLLPGVPNTILILPGSTFGATAATAATPAFSGGIAIGVITVQDNGTGGTGTITNIPLNNITQFAASGSGGSGSGSGSPLDPQADESFIFYTRSDFGVDSNTFEASTTGTDQILGLKKVILNVGNQFVSKDLTGKQVWDDAIVINQAQVRALYNVGKVDLSPTIEISRDGGNSFSTATTYPLASDGNLIIGDYAWPAVTTATYSGGTPSGGTLSGLKVAAIFKPTFRTLLSSFQLYMSTSATSGSIKGNLYSVSSGTPQAVLVACVEVYSAGSDINTTKGYKTFTLATPYTLTAGTNYAFVAESTTATISCDTVTASVPTFSQGSSSFASGWVASGTSAAYQVFGTGADLRVRITSATALSELAGFGVNYISDSPAALTGMTTWEERTITSTEASTGLITLTRAQYTPGLHQLQVFANGHVFIAPDFAEVSPSQVQFPANYFQSGDTIRFYVGFGLVDGSSSAISKISALYDCIVGSQAQFSAGIATHVTLQSAINSAPSGGMVLVLPRVSLTENVTCNKNIFIEGSGQQSVLNGTFTFATGASDSIVNYMKFAGNVTIPSGVNNLIISENWVNTTGGAAISNNGTNNIIGLNVGE